MPSTTSLPPADRATPGAPPSPSDPWTAAREGAEAAVRAVAGYRPVDPIMCVGGAVATVVWAKVAVGAAAGGPPGLPVAAGATVGALGAARVTVDSCRSR